MQTSSDDAKSQKLQLAQNSESGLPPPLQHVLLHSRFSSLIWTALPPVP